MLEVKTKCLNNILLSTKGLIVSKLRALTLLFILLYLAPIAAITPAETYKNMTSWEDQRAFKKALELFNLPMETATEEDIRNKYKQLALKHHPDKGGDEAKFKEIGTAYEVLTKDYTNQESTTDAWQRRAREDEEKIKRKEQEEQRKQFKELLQRWYSTAKPVGIFVSIITLAYAYDCYCTAPESHPIEDDTQIPTPKTAGQTQNNSH